MSSVTVVDIEGASPAEMTAELVGGKALGLMQLSALGLRVPPAFVLGTDACQRYLGEGREGLGDLRELCGASLRRMEEATQRRFGDARRPLLVSVRSGAPVSMPGMLETVLNVGLCERTLPGLLRASGNPRQVFDVYRRLIQSFAEVVFAAPAAPFAAVIDRFVEEQGVESERELDAFALRAAVRQSLLVFERCVGQPFPQEPWQQLELAVRGVFESWNSARAREFRRMQQLDGLVGTAVTVQAMVFGNAGGASGAGVGFTRDPATGANELYMDFLFNAQGDDVVSGRHVTHGAAELQQLLPCVHDELVALARRLETKFRDVQDFEFTVDSGVLYLLQTRAAKRTPWAALRIAVDMVEEGLIAPEAALQRVSGLDLRRLRRVRLDSGGRPPLAQAIAAGTGVAVGQIALLPETALAMAEGGRPVILVRKDISTEDIAAMAASTGVLTASGGRTSHAAVVARELDKPCLVGCGVLAIDMATRRCELAGQILREGELLSLDCSTGGVYAGRLAELSEVPERELAIVEGWKNATAGEQFAQRTC